MSLVEKLFGSFSDRELKKVIPITKQVLALEPMLTDSLLQEFLGQLDRIRLVRRDERGEWLLARDLDDLPLCDLYEACQLRIPVAEAHLPFHDDALGCAARRALDDLRVPLRELLKKRVSDLYVESCQEPA